MIRPTARISISVDEGLFSDEIVAELRRSYLYVSPVSIESRRISEAPLPAENAMGLTVKLNKPYWYSSDEGADQAWNEIMLPWLDAKLYKLESAILAFNKNKRERGEEEIHYAHFETIFGDTVFSFKTYETSKFPQVSKLLDRYRLLLNEGILRDLVIVRVEMSWIDPASYAAGEVSDESGEKADGVGADDSSVGSTDGDADGAGTEAETQEASEEPINFTVWDIVTADGIHRKIDSEKGVWID